MHSEEFIEESDEECAHCPGSPTGRQGSDLMAAKAARQRRVSLGGDQVYTTHNHSLPVLSACSALDCLLAFTAVLCGLCSLRSDAHLRLNFVLARAMPPSDQILLRHIRLSQCAHSVHLQATYTPLR